MADTNRVTTPEEGASENIDNTQGISWIPEPIRNARAAISGLLLGTMVAAGPVQADRGPIEITPAAYTQAEGDEVQLASLDPEDFTRDFISGLEEGLGGDTITPEMQTRLDVLSQNYLHFTQALIVELEAYQPVLGQTPRERASHPDVLDASQAFMAMNQVGQIQVVQAFASGMNVIDAVTSVAPQLGNSREVMDNFYGEWFIQDLRRSIARANRPDVLDPSIQVSEEDYLERITLILENSGLHAAMLTYVLDQQGQGFTPRMNETQFYGVLNLARVSFDEGRWDERDDERRHAGKTRQVMEALLTQDASEYSNRTADFFETIGFESAAAMHPEIAEAYAATLRADAAETRADENIEEARARAIEEERLANMMRSIREILEGRTGS